MTLSIEEIRLITEKLEKIDKQDLQKVVQDTLKIFQGLITASDAYNETHIKKFDKPAQWYKMDVEVKRKNPVVDPSLFRQIQTKIFQFGKSNRNLLKSCGLYQDRLTHKTRDINTYRHTDISWGILNGDNIYQIATNCGNTVGVIQNHYAKELVSRDFEEDLSSLRIIK